MKKNRLILIIAVASITAALITIIFFLGTQKTEKIKNITFAHSFTDEKAEAVRNRLRHYQQINPNVFIEENYLTPQALQSETVKGSITPDIFIWDGPVPRTLPFSVSGTFHWTGNLWTLLVNPDLLDSGDVEMLKNGIDFTGFSQILLNTLESGITPISVGNSHHWPLTIWEQHIEASLSEVPDPKAEPVLGNFSDSRYDAWELMRAWYKRGYFLEETWNEGWARGLIAVPEGKAAMALMSGNMITTIPADSRDSFLYLSFPQSGKEKWAIGTGSSIVINDDSEHKNESEKLLAYLTSDAITKLLTRELRTLFYSSEQTSADVYLPSWETLANSEEMREYGSALRDYAMK